MVFVASFRQSVKVWTEFDVQQARTPPSLTLHRNRERERFTGSTEISDYMLTPSPYSTGFCHDHALILYVYLSNEDNGGDDSVLTVCLVFLSCLFFHGLFQFLLIANVVLVGMRTEVGGGHNISKLGQLGLLTLI